MVLIFKDEKLFFLATLKMSHGVVLNIAKCPNKVATKRKYMI